MELEQLFQKIHKEKRGKTIKIRVTEQLKREITGLSAISLLMTEIPIGELKKLYKKKTGKDFKKVLAEQQQK